jgi:2-oxoglutarate dehydrogenase E2 component (dihydrolipoamide succinyltransferase)
MIVRMEGNTIAEIYTAVEGFELEECFHPDVLRTAVEVEDYLSVGCAVQEDGSWLDAEGEVIPESVPVEPVEEEAPAEEAPAEEAPAEEAPAEEAPAEEAPAEEPAPE